MPQFLARWPGDKLFYAAAFVRKDRARNYLFFRFENGVRSIKQALPIDLPKGVTVRVKYPAKTASDAFDLREYQRAIVLKSMVKQQRYLVELQTSKQAVEVLAWR